MQNKTYIIHHSRRERDWRTPAHAQKEKKKIQKENTPIASHAPRLGGADQSGGARRRAPPSAAEGGRRVHNKKSHDWFSVGSRPNHAASRALV